MALSLNSPQVDIRRESAALQELGYSVDRTYAERDPARHRTFRRKLEATFLRSQTPDSTFYAKANPKELFADGFRLYHQERAALRTANPALYELVKEAVEAMQS